MADKINNDVLLVDALLRIKVLEEVVISNKLITEEQLRYLVNTKAQQIAHKILSVPYDLPNS